MQNRSATDTILGYFYQFDYSIEMLLSLSNDHDSIMIEGIEDIDISSATEKTAIQCKYYSKTTYNHSIIANPIRLMLSHYKQVIEGKKPKLKYKLYGYYNSGQSKLKLPINLDFLKTTFLSYTKEKIKYEHHTDLGLGDNDLLDFLKLLEINLYAKKYTEQYSNIIKCLQHGFSCDAFEAENYFYNNALKVIKDIAIKDIDSDRIISKRDFLSEINKREILFNSWFLKLKGKEKHFKELRKKYFSNLNTSPFERFFLIEIPKGFNRSELKNLIFNITQKWSKLSKRTTEPFCPYLYLHNLPETELVEIKNDLQEENFSFIDGYDFFGSSFNVKSVIKQANYNNQIKIQTFPDKYETH